MNGYGIFVWSSFFLTFLVCAVVYYKTRKTLKKYEKEFAKEIILSSQVTIKIESRGNTDNKRRYTCCKIGKPSKGSNTLEGSRVELKRQGIKTLRSVKKLLK